MKKIQHFDTIGDFVIRELDGGGLIEIAGEHSGLLVKPAPTNRSKIIFSALLTNCTTPCNITANL